MIEFVRVIFRGLFTVGIVICMIAVVIFGISLFEDSALIGLLVIIGGLIVVVSSAGLIATILNIDEKLEIIAESISKMNSSFHTIQGSSQNSGKRSIVGNKLQKKCKRCKKEVDEDYSACPHCGNNTFE